MSQIMWFVIVSYSKNPNPCNSCNLWFKIGILLWQK